MKFIFIDTNMRNNDGSYYIDDNDISRKQLDVGDIVIAYQEKDMWKAEIVLSENGYGVILKSVTSEISDERFEGHKEGFDNGQSIQKLRTIKLLQRLNADPLLIEEVRKNL